jgi:hypothetical protein
LEKPQSRFDEAERYSTLLAILSQMHAMLVKYGFPQRRIVEAAISTVERGSRDSISHSLNSGEIWGSSGSVLDVSLILPKETWTESNVADDVALTVLERQLAEEMERLHIATDLVIGRKRLLDRVLSNRIMQD